MVNFRRALRHLEVAEYEAMLSLLANVFICRVLRIVVSGRPLLLALFPPSLS